MTFQKDINDVGKFARLVVAKRVAIVTIVTVVLNLLISYHVITPDISNYATTWVKETLDALATIVAVIYAQKAVTPLVDPRDNDGNPLVPDKSGVK